MNILCFKFHKNRAINEELDFWGGQILSVGPFKEHGASFCFAESFSLEFSRLLVKKIVFSKTDEKVVEFMSYSSNLYFVNNDLHRKLNKLQK